MCGAPTSKKFVGTMLKILARVKVWEYLDRRC